MPPSKRKRQRSHKDEVDDSSSTSLSATPLSFPSPATPGLGQSLEQRKQTLLYQLSPYYLPPSLPSLESPHSILSDLLSRTLTSQHNNACLIIGFPGSGKSTLTRSVLHSLLSHHRPLGHSFTTVLLSGLLHSDDTQAMKEVVRQLTADMEIEKPPSSADFATLLSYLLDVLSSSFSSQPIFFILDHFEGFAENKPKQTFLYNLCDLLQAQRTQLAIIALTSRLDCFDLLEKRIKSRLFSRKLILSQPQGEEDMKQVIRQRLSLSKQGVRKALTKRSPLEIDFVPGKWQWREDEEVEEGESSAIEQHHAAVEEILNDGEVRDLLRYQMELGKSVRWFLTQLTMVVCRLSEDAPFPTAQSMTAALKAGAINWRREQLKYSSIVEWCILVAVMHVEAKGISPYNYAILYEEYRQFTAKHSQADIETFPSSLFLASFERLLGRGVLKLEGRGGEVNCELSMAGLVDRQFMSVRRTVESEEVEGLLRGSEVIVPQWLKNWALNERTE